MPILRARTLAFAAFAAAGCTAGTASETSTETGATGKADGADQPTARHCTDGTMPHDLPTAPWNHWENAIIAGAAPGHSARDVLATRAGDAEIFGKFAYGPTSKDLEDERVQVWVDDCEGGRRLLGEAVTDGDGRIAFSLEPGDLPGIGVYGVTMRVLGDGSTVDAELSVYPAGTRIVIFDIDATLTTADWEVFKDVVADLFEPILDGDYVPEAREAAADITLLRHSQGYPVVYLTGRPYWLTSISRQWLFDGGFAPGTLMLTQSMLDVVPSNDFVGDYKANFLIELSEAGFVIEAAYGNATTDIYAYEMAGVPAERTFILGDHGGERGTVAVGEGYGEHIDAAAAEPLPDQPFTW